MWVRDMTNDRCSQIEAKFEARSANRDAEFAVHRDLLTRVAEGHRNLETGVEALRDKITAIENRPQPSVFKYWAPSVATAVAIATAGIFILNQALMPISERIQAVTVRLDDAKLDRERIEGRQFDISTKLAEVVADTRAVKEALDRHYDKDH